MNETKTRMFMTMGLVKVPPALAHVVRSDVLAYILALKLYRLIPANTAARAEEGHCDSFGGVRSLRLRPEHAKFQLLVKFKVHVRMSYLSRQIFITSQTF